MSLRTSISKYVANKRYNLPVYTPLKKQEPDQIMDVVSAWKGLELIIEDILEQFDIGREKCIEFGVDYCYSTVIFANYFEKVIGVDLFTGDIHSGHKTDHFAKTKKSIEKFANIELIKSDYKDYILNNDEQFDLAHVDIVHTYEETFECGLWAVEHSKCCIFHDTESFPEVKRAVFDLARTTGKKVYNYPFHHGLGIIV